MERISLALKAMAHNERLRILALLSHGELTVSELVKIMGLSQPRITQYIKSLEDAGIVDRLKEGSWVFSRINRTDKDLFHMVLEILQTLPTDNVVLRADRRRLDDIRAERAITADNFFGHVANDDGQLGDEFLPRKDLDQKIRDCLDREHYDFMIDFGTGTGRMLQLLSDRISRGVGVDNNSEMLKVARHRLTQLGHSHLSVRHGELSATPFQAGTADLVSIHQVLHYLDDPSRALREASRVLRPGGQLLLVDFTSHDQDEFREKYAHRRLGFSNQEIKAWAKAHNLHLKTTENVNSGSGKPDVQIWLCERTD